VTRSMKFVGVAVLVGALTVAWSTHSNARTDGAPGILSQVGIDQKLGEKIPLDLQFRDGAGNAVSLSDYFNDKPVVLSLVYYDCPMLCTQVLNGLLGSMKALTLNAGGEFEVVTVSFDSRETPELALEKKKVYLDQYDRAGAEEGWHFLTGDEASVAALTKSVGFRYAWDEDTQQFAHASGIMVLTPDGTLARYFYGIEFAPRDLKLGLVEASDGKIGSPVDQILLYCFYYDPVKGKYGLAIMNIIRILGTATILVMGTAIFLMIRRGRVPQAA
jgi:protein SCO1/2